MSAVVARGADINALDKDGHGVLDVPIFQMDTDFLEHLLKLGANPNIPPNSDGDSVLDLAEFDYCALHFVGFGHDPPTASDKLNIDTWIAYLDRVAAKQNSQRPVCLSLLRAKGAKTADELKSVA